jgi:YrbI family 3-deoxy-D-manno-octulosonate 8-phosphate phosphatase
LTGGTYAAGMAEQPPPTVAVIPARGGSKGIPGKNLRLVGGVPLVGRAVRAARAASRVDVVVVSTDDPAIAEAARSWGAEVVDRPADLSGDTASSESAVLHALDHLVGRGHPEPAVCLLVQCTSPFISPADIDGVAGLVLDGHADSAFTAAPSHAFLWREGPDTTDGAVGINHDERHRQRRQDRPPELVETGAAYAMATAGLRASGHRFSGRLRAHVVPALHAIEIDEEPDLLAAQALAPVVDASLGLRPPLPDPVGVVVFDFDGVMTDDRALVLQDGTEGVLVHRGDGMGIERLRRAGVPLLVLSKERNPVVEARCRKLQVPCLQGIEDKWPALQAWLAEQGIDPASAVYVGNDINDLDCLAGVGCAVAVADANPRVRERAHVVLTRPGGFGAVRELAELVLADLVTVPEAGPGGGPGA